MVGVSSGSVLLSEVTINQDLDMGAYDIVMGAAKTVDGKDVGVDLMDKTTYDSDGVGKVNVLAAGSVNSEEKLKIVSNDLRHSIDAPVSKTTVVEWEKKKTLTFVNGIKGILRIKWDMKTSNVNHTAYAILTNDGATPGVDDLGAEQTEDGTAYITKTQDIALDVAPGGTIDLWLKPKYTTSTSYAENFRAYYNENGVAVSVTGAD